MENNLWYHYLTPSPPHSAEKQPKIHKLTNAALHELWHHRLGHPGQTVTELIHLHVDGVPKVRPNKFYNCAGCMVGKFRSTHIGKSTPTLTNNIINQLPSDLQQKLKVSSTTTPLPCKQFKVGKHLHMDYGFVRGSDWSAHDNNGKLVTSVDHYRSYLLVIDRASRYI